MIHWLAQICVGALQDRRSRVVVIYLSCLIAVTCLLRLQEWMLQVRLLTHNVTVRRKQPIFGVFHCHHFNVIFVASVRFR